MFFVPIILAALLAVTGAADAEGLTCWTTTGNLGTRIFAGCINDPPLHPPPHIAKGVGDDCANGETVVECPSLRQAPKIAVAPKPAPRCGTLFGYVPDDGRAAPINELLCDIRGAIFMTFIWPRLGEVSR